MDEFLADAQFRTQRIRLHGIVGSEQLVIDPDDRAVTFVMLGKSGKLKVEYSGTIPDLFKVGGEVVAVGRMGDSGTFQADELLTKCASKYEMKRAAAEKPI